MAQSGLKCLLAILVISLIFVISLQVASMAQANDGRIWEEMDSNTTVNLYDIWGSSSSDVFAVGEDGTILHYDGSTWEEMTSNTTKTLYDISGSSSSDVFAITCTITEDTRRRHRTYWQYENIILHYDGSTWEEMTSNTTKCLRGIWGSSSSDVFVVGSDGTILRYGIEPEVTVTVPRTKVTVTVPRPTVAGVSISSGDQEATLEVVITGAKFSGATTVSFGHGITVNRFTADSSTQITAYISIAADATVGARDISITTTGGSGKLYDGFTVTVPAPTLTGVSVGSGNQGITLDVAITGADFTGATDVSFGSGITVNSFTVDSLTKITASISVAADATIGVRDVSVTTPAGTGTLTGAFAVEVAPPKPPPPTAPPPPTTTPQPVTPEPTPSEPARGPSCGFGAGTAGLGELLVILGVVLVGFVFTRFRQR